MEEILLDGAGVIAVSIVVLRVGNQITQQVALPEKYGIPIVGAFFVDRINALVIKFFIGIPFMQHAVLPRILIQTAARG